MAANPKETGKRRGSGLLKLLVLLTVPLAFTLLSGTLSSEPYMAVRDGYKCSQCHVNKTGGGKRTDYAQVYMHTRNAASPGSEVGEDRFLHGRLNDHFSIGGDLRQVLTYQNPRDGEAGYQFGRTNTCVSCHRDNDGGGKRAEIYVQFELVPGKASVVLSQNLLPTSSPREVYALLDSGPLNGYVKAGTFRLPTGLQNTFDDPWFHGVVNKGFKGLVGLESVRGDGVEIGIEPGPFALAVSFTNPLTLRDDDNSLRMHLNAYAVGRGGLIGFSYYDDPVSSILERRYLAVYGGINIGRLTGMGELDFFTETDPTTDTTTDKLAGLLQVDFLLFRGHNLKYQYEFFDPDTDAEQDIRDRTSLIYEPFLNPYLQIRTGARFLEGPVNASGVEGESYFLELHLLF